jgi:small subunit ribosomal protein S17
MKTLQGIVTSTKQEQTVVVRVTRRWQHPLYKKYVKRSKKYACHCVDLELVEGDSVLIEETRPMSKTKHFRVVSKVEAVS